MKAFLSSVKGRREYSLRSELQRNILDLSRSILVPPRPEVELPNRNDESWDRRARFGAESRLDLLSTEREGETDVLDLDLNLSILEPGKCRLGEFADDLLRFVPLPDSSCSTLDVLELDNPLLLPPLKLDSVVVEEISELSDCGSLESTMDLVQTNLQDAKRWFPEGRLASPWLTRSVEGVVLSSEVDRDVG